MTYGHLPRVFDSVPAHWWQKRWFEVRLSAGNTYGAGDCDLLWHDSEIDADLALHMCIANHFQVESVIVDEIDALTSELLLLKFKELLVDVNCLLSLLH